jgi:hypothetical protein
MPDAEAKKLLQLLEKSRVTAIERWANGSFRRGGFHAMFSFIRPELIINGRLVKIHAAGDTPRSRSSTDKWFADALTFPVTNSII